MRDKHKSPKGGREGGLGQGVCLNKKYRGDHQTFKWGRGSVDRQQNDYPQRSEGTNQGIHSHKNDRNRGFRVRNIHFYSHPTQHHSFFRDFPPYPFVIFLILLLTIPLQQFHLSWLSPHWHLHPHHHPLKIKCPNKITSSLDHP